MKLYTLLLSPFLMFLPASFAEVADTAEMVTPVAKGDQAPNPSLRTLEGDATTLNDLHGGEPTVLVFYRGGWCPYCTRHLSALQEVMPRIRENGWKLVAVSPDTPEHLAETSKEHNLEYTLVSDSSLEAAKAFGLAFQVDEDTVRKYVDYGINLTEASGESHHQLPVPAVFLINSDRTIAFVHHDPDYRKRLESEELLRILQEEE